MERRSFVRAASGATAVALAGCITRENDDGEPAEPDEEGELRVATRPSMVRGEEPASERLREAFEEEYPDAEIVWTVPEAGVELYVRQRQSDADVGADLYLGLTVPDLVEIDAALGDEMRLFEPVDRGRLTHADRFSEDLALEDPADRVLPVATNYVAIVYDETRVEAPESFADLQRPGYGRSLLIPDARTSRTGLAFLLWTISEFGEPEAFDYWAELAETDVTLVENWADAYYGAYADGDGSAIVGYSTAGVLASVNDWDPDRHRVAFLDGGGYETVEGVGVFAETARTELAYDFVDFVLSTDAQRTLATRGGRFPAVGGADAEPDESFAERARRPVESASFAYDDLTGRLADWIDAWSDSVDG